MFFLHDKLNFVCRPRPTLLYKTAQKYDDNSILKFTNSFLYELWSELLVTEISFLL